MKSNSSRFSVLLLFILLMISGCSGDISGFADLAGLGSQSSDQTFTCTVNAPQDGGAVVNGVPGNLNTPPELNPIRLGFGLGLALIALLLIGYTIWRYKKSTKQIRILLCTLSIFFSLSSVYVFKSHLIYLLSVSPSDAISYYLIDFFWFLFLGLSINRLLDNFLWHGLLQKNDKTLVPRIYILVTHTLLYVVVTLLFLHFGLGRSLSTLLFTSSAVFAVLIYLSRPVTDSAIAGFMVENAVMEKGDHVQIGEYVGTVQDVDSQRVILYSDEGNLVYLPNTDVQTKSVINHTRPNSTMMLEVSFPLEYETTPGRAMKLIDEAIAELDQRIGPYSVYIKEFNQFGITYGIFYTHEYDAHRRSQTAILSAIYYKVKKDPYSDFGYDKYDSSNNSPLSSENKTTHQAFARLLKEAQTQKIDTLKEIDFFAALSQDHLEELAKHCVARVFGPPENIIRQGDPGDSMFVIVEGKARVFLTRENAEPIEVAVDGPGSFFGEMALLTGKPRGATVRAIDDICLLEIPKSGLQVLFEREPSLVKAISEIVTARKAQTTAIEKTAREHDQAAESTFADALRASILKFFGLKAQ